MSVPAPVSARWRRRPVPVLVALAVLLLTLAVAVTIRPVGLGEVLLIALVEVLGVSLVAGRSVAAVTAVAAVAAVNWFLIPPYGTFRIQSEDNIVSLAVFLLLAVGMSSLVDAVIRWEAAASAAAAREAMLAGTLSSGRATPQEALAAFREAFALDSAILRERESGRTLLRSDRVGPDPGFSEHGRPALSALVEPGYELVGFGAEILGPQRDFAQTLATAVVRAWESQELAAQQERALRLAEIDAARSALLASIGHDLRTPLAGIRLSADALILADDQLSARERSELLAGLRESALRLDQILGAVLDSSRVEAGVLVVKDDAVDLRAVVRAAVEPWQDARLALVLPEQPLMARADPGLLERIVGNLVSNAIAHAPPPDPIRVGCRRSGQAAVIEVVDHGPGLNLAGVDQGRSGQGLGLLIVDRLAAVVGAEVSYQQTPGGGLTATVALNALAPGAVEAGRSGRLAQQGAR